MGGDRDVATCRCSTCSTTAPAADAVADAGALRPARGAGRAGALPGVPRDGASSRTAATSRRADAGEVARARALRARIRARAPTRGARRRPARRARPPRDVDVVGDARGPAAAGDRRGRAPAAARPASTRTARASAAGAAGCGCRSARTRRGSTRCSRRPACAPSASTSPTCRVDEHLRPLRSPAGPLLVPIDRATIELVWSRGGYPSRRRVPQLPRLHEHRHRAWAIDGAPYDPARARAQARARRRATSSRASRARRRRRAVRLRARHRAARRLVARGRRVARRGARRARRAGLADRPARRRARRASRRVAGAAELPVTSWGTPRDLTTWSGAAGGRPGLAQRARRAAHGRRRAGAPTRALRELLALQSATGPSSSSARPPRRTGASAPRPRARRRRARGAGSTSRAAQPRAAPGAGGACRSVKGAAGAGAVNGGIIEGCSLAGGTAVGAGERAGH